MTITSKWQVTLPAKLIRALGWKPPLKVRLEEQGGRIFLSPVSHPSAKRKTKGDTSS